MASVSTLTPTATGGPDKASALNEYLTAVVAEASQLDKQEGRLSEERKEKLRGVATYIADKVHQGEAPRLLFVCTHNSRRSQLSQVWCKVLAVYFDIPLLESFSAGTEVTAFHPNALVPLQEAGIHVSVASDAERKSDNPVYELTFETNLRTGELKCFSKLIADASNPSAEFCAVMTCTSANKGCPFVHGARSRIPLSFQDPKSADGTPDEKAAYQRASHLIAVELAYALQMAKQLAS